MLSSEQELTSLAHRLRQELPEVLVWPTVSSTSRRKIALSDSDAWGSIPLSVCDQPSLFARSHLANKRLTGGRVTSTVPLLSLAIGVDLRTVWHLATNTRVRQQDIDSKHLFHRRERNFLFATSLSPDRIAHRLSILLLRSCPVPYSLAGFLGLLFIRLRQTINICVDRG